MAAQQLARARAAAGGHVRTMAGDTAVERVTGPEPAWPAWKAGSCDPVCAGQPLMPASGRGLVTHM